MVKKSNNNEMPQKLQDVVHFGMPVILADRLPLGVFHCMRNKRIRISRHLATDVSLERHPHKCLVWSAVQRRDGSCMEMRIYVKGNATDMRSGHMMNAILEVLVEPPTDAIDVILHIGNDDHQSGRYTGLGKENYMRLLAASSSAHERNAIMDIVSSIMVEACKKPDDRHVVGIRIRPRTVLGGYGHLEIDTRQGTRLSFIPDENAEW